MENRVLKTFEWQCIVKDFVMHSMDVKHDVLLIITFDGNLPEVTEHNDKDEDNAAHCYRDEQSHLVDAVVHIV